MNRQVLKNKALTAYRNLSKRERLLILGGVASIFIIAIYSVTAFILDTFSAQDRKIVALQRNYTSANISLDRYDKLISRLKNLEKNFKKEGPSGGVRSYLEQTIINKAKVASGGFSIRPGATRALGENYSQAPFSISFNTTKISDIVAFLTEITQGESNLLLTKLEIIKGRSAEKLTVTVDVSSISNVKN